MPNGWCRPSAKTDVCCGLPSAPTPRKTGSCPSGFRPGRCRRWARCASGAGLSRPVAYSSTLNPLGACGQALAGRATTLGPLSTDFLGRGAGRSAAVRWRRVPGDSWGASVNAALPVRACFWSAVFAGVWRQQEASVAAGNGENQNASRKRCMGPLGRFERKRLNRCIRKDRKSRNAEATERPPVRSSDPQPRKEESYRGQLLR